MPPATPLRLALAGLGVLLALVALAPAGPDEAKGKKYALLVGVTDYDSSKLPPLKYTENDAVELEKLLGSKSAGFHHVRVLTSARGKQDRKDAPTAANVRAALAEVTAKRTRHDSVLIALSGHGIQLEVPHPDDDRVKPNAYGYFCPADADLSGKVSHSTGKSDTLILVKEFLDALDGCGAGVKLLLMDACRNELKAEAATRSLDVRRFSIPDDTAALFSCKAGQRAYETKQLRHGVFFHFVLQGLRGGAKNERGEVTWDLLVNYVKEHVSDGVPELVGGGARQDPHGVSNLAGKSPVLARVEAGKKADSDAPAKVKGDQKKREDRVRVKKQTTGYDDEEREMARDGIVPAGATGVKVRLSEDELAWLVVLDKPKGVRVWILAEHLESE
jgi:uncharacterized caspase-like protein